MIAILILLIAFLTSYPLIVPSLSAALPNNEQPNLEISVEGVGVVLIDNEYSQIQDTETSTLPQTIKETIYSDFNTFSLGCDDWWVQAGMVDIYDFEGKIKDLVNKDAQFFVYLSTEGHKDGLWEEIQNTVIPGYKSAKPMTTVEAGDILGYYYEFVKYSQIKTDDDYKKYANYHVISKEKVNDDYRIYAVYDDGSIKYYGKEIHLKDELDEHFGQYSSEYIQECVDIYYELQEQIRIAYYNVHKRYFDQIGITVKYDNSASFHGTWAGYFTYLTLDEIEKLKELPFGIRLHLMPKFVETRFTNGTLTHDPTIIYEE